MHLHGTFDHPYQFYVKFVVLVLRVKDGENVTLHIIRISSDRGDSNVMGRHGLSLSLVLCRGALLGACSTPLTVCVLSK